MKIGEIIRLNLSWLVIFLQRFDFDQKKSKTIFKILVIAFVVASAWLSLKFITTAVDRAHSHDLWLDERNGQSARTAGYIQLIKGDLGSQCSRSPLEYLAQKIFDQAGGLSLRTMGLEDNIYYRLHSIFYNWISGLLVVLIAFFKIKKGVNNYFVFGLQILLLLGALWLYYFWRFNFPFSIQMRPYALWNSLWLMILCLFLVEGRLKGWPFTVLFFLLAATMNVAIWQLFSFTAAFMIVRLAQKESFLQSAKIILKILLIPTAVSLYYILIDSATYSWYEDFDQYLKEFFHFWTTKEMIPILSTLGILLTVWYKELQNHTIIFLTMLILYLISPLINYIILSRGIFFSSRHYIYYDLIYPVFLVSMAIITPSLWERIRQYSLNQEIKRFP